MYILIDRIQGVFNGYEYKVSPNFPTPRFVPLEKVYTTAGGNSIIISNCDMYPNLDFANSEATRNEELIKEQIGVIVNLMVVSVDYLIKSHGSIKDIIEWRATDASS